MFLASQENRSECHEDQGCQERPRWELPEDGQRECDTDEGCESKQDSGSGGPYSAE